MITVGSYVRIGKGRKVYQVSHVVLVDQHGRADRVTQYKLSATADHPDAAVREQDAFALYPADRLTEVRRRR